jgi:hypothetical protein
LGADRQKRLKSGSIGISAGSISRIGNRLCAFGGQYRLKRELHSDGSGGCKTLNKYDANSFLQVRSSSAIINPMGRCHSLVLHPQSFLISRVNLTRVTPRCVVGSYQLE